MIKDCVRRKLLQSTLKPSSANFYGYRCLLELYIRHTMCGCTNETIWQKLYPPPPPSPTPWKLEFSRRLVRVECGMQSMRNNFKMSRWSVRTFKWKSMRNGSWTGYYTVEEECENMQQFVDCCWTDKVSHHTRNLVLLNVALS
jgi:hypothetical protein